MARCKKGTRKNKKTGNCDSVSKNAKKRSRCANGTRKNKKTGECTKHTYKKKIESKAKATTKSTKSNSNSNSKMEYTTKEYNKIHKIPDLSHDEYTSACRLFQKIMKKHMLEKKYYKDYDDDKVELIEEVLEYTVPEDMLSELNDYCKQKDEDALYQIVQKSLKETQSQLNYYKKNKVAFPNLEKISLNFANEDYKYNPPWSPFTIRTMNDIATDDDRQRFDYEEVVKFNKENFEILEK